MLLNVTIYNSTMDPMGYIYISAANIWGILMVNITIYSMGYISHEIHQSSAFSPPRSPRGFPPQPGERKSGIPDSTEMPAPVKAVMEPPVNPWSFREKSSMMAMSLDWFKGKSTGNRGFYHQV